MNHCRLFVLYVLVPVFLLSGLSCFLPVYGQTGSVAVSGLVLDEAGEPVSGAGIMVKGTSKGTVSDLDGNFP